MSTNVELQKRIEDHEKRLAKLEELFLKKTEVPKKKLSLREFVLTKKPQNDVYRALAIGYFLEKYEGFPCFTTKDIEQGFRRARERVPSNVPDKIFKNRNNGHMMKSEKMKDKKTAYVLTNSGMAFVENDFVVDD